MRIVDYLDPVLWLRSDAGPRYIQLRHRLEQAIAEGVLPPAAPLPPEREIAELTGLSRVTVRRAIQDLAENGLVVQRHGSGSFVSGTVGLGERPLSHLHSFSEEMRRRGVITSSIWLERGRFMPAPEEVVALGIATGEEVTRLARIRRAEGHPLALERTTLPVNILPNPFLVENSLYDTLNLQGIRPIRAIQKVSAINLREKEARLLEVDPGFAGLSIQRISYLQNSRAVEFTLSVYRGDSYDFVTESRLTP
ncbi:MAG: GntR family transcriptional regulator [Pseudorhodobacter sp.]